MIDIPLQMTLAALAGLGAGFVLAWLLQRGRGAQALERARLEAEAALAPLRERARLLEAEREALRVEQADVLARAEGWREALEKTRAERAVLAERLLAERRNAEEKIALLQQAREALSDQFKALAADILEEKSKRFTEQNQTNIGQLLEPLRERLQAFQGTVEQVYVQEGKDRSALAEQVRQLMELNRALGEDAKNLTRALKGSVKAQGNWGELVLERVLEASGLRKGVEYDTQQSHAREDGSRAQPDVVIHLPEDRHLVVDAKVSLTAYEACVVAEDEAARQLAVRRHLESVRAHIKGLAERNYQQIHGVGSLDFVLMFVPIEPAFMLAVTHDDALFMDAWQKNVLLVGPSTLLFVVRTVAHLWRQEGQGRNAQEIARRGGELYDKLVGFVDDMDALGNRLAQAQKSFDAAYGKFARGRGNLVRQAEMLRELGVTPAKALSPALVERALEDDAADAAPVRPALRVAGDEAG
ncbi:DNA recombination protein RmuC [Azoarcus olearius]|uniref:Conserved hypothetical RumC homolog n=1 Tax=Azoarcus sp. (strain BH72) TaxID=418699 RepID=A1K998_AZOSB|nr:DNA recombination protein RmuC [Azoarcus olearius]CAL95403.1 conserved hypothetical RumC homolog [Azoarcus olearius]